MKQCLNCGIILKETSNSNYCSGQCNPDIGGLRKGSGRGKKGWYKGYYCDSTYELAYVIYNIDNGISFERCTKKIPYIYNGKKSNYHPDFEIGDTLIEIKGYHTEQVDAKIKATREAGFKIEILYEKDLKNVFDYVKDNYDYKYIEEMYDDFKPLFTYVCDCCNNTFIKNTKILTKIKYCSASCSMIKNREKYKYNSDNHSNVMKEYYKRNPDKCGRGIPKSKVKCPHCCKEGSANNMSRWHFDNCKLKISSGDLDRI